MDPEVPGSSPGGGTICDTEISPFSAHSRYAAYTAERLGLQFRSLDGPDAYLFEIVAGGRRALFSTGSGSPYAINRASSTAIARDKAFCNVALRDAGLPIIPSEMFFANTEHVGVRSPGREPHDALRYARSVTFPVFCKPVLGSQGEFAEVIRDYSQFERYLQRVGAVHYAILIQPYIRAQEHRVFVLDHEAIFSYSKTTPSLVGDGIRNVAELVAQAASKYRPGQFLPAPPETILAVAEDGATFSAFDVPDMGLCVSLEGPANRAVGGGTSPPTEDVPRELASLSVKAADTLGLRLAAVDVFSLSDGRLLVIEVNSSPAIRTLESYGRWDLIEMIWKANITCALGETVNGP